MSQEWTTGKDRTDRRFDVELADGDVIEFFINGNPVAVYSWTAKNNTRTFGNMRIIVQDENADEPDTLRVAD